MAHLPHRTLLPAPVLSTRAQGRTKNTGQRRPAASDTTGSSLPKLKQVQAMPPQSMAIQSNRMMRPDSQAGNVTTMQMRPPSTPRVIPKNRALESWCPIPTRWTSPGVMRGVMPEAAMRVISSEIRRA